MKHDFSFYRCTQKGATLVEAVIVFPIFLFMVLAIMQAGFVYYAKSNVNYATYEAARAGTVNQAKFKPIHDTFIKAMTPYYGGGRNLGELAVSGAKATVDIDDNVLRIEILSPTPESFTDFNSPKLQTLLKVSDPVIPNVGLDELTCPRDVPACKSNPKSNASGQTLLDANLLKLRVTYGIPERKQMPLVGKFYTWALGKLGAGSGDSFKQDLIDAGRIPIVTSTVMRMQSDAIKNDKMVSNPGPGNDGKPVDPGPPPDDPTLPTCPWWDPACVSCPDGLNTPGCRPDTCAGPKL